MRKGKITQIIGAVVDVKFDGELPTRFLNELFEYLSMEHKNC